MKTEMPLEQPVPTDKAAKPEDVVVQPITSRIAYKTVLSAVVIGIITISVLWMFVLRQEDSLRFEESLTEPDILLQGDTIAKEFPVVTTDSTMASMGRMSSLMFEEIKSGFAAQETHSAFVKRELLAMTEMLQMIEAAVTDLGESNQELGRRISGAISRLDTLARNARARKVAKRKPAVTHKPRPAKHPPFQIDAIDVWDDVTYVAVSQSARVAFLEVGEQQSGWTVTRIERSKSQIDFKGPAGQVYSTSVQR